MTKIEEIIKKSFGVENNEDNADLYCDAENAMKEYAEWYCKKFKNQVKGACWVMDQYQTWEPSDGEYLITEEGIDKITLPTHD